MCTIIMLNIFILDTFCLLINSLDEFFLSYLHCVALLIHFEGGKNDTVGFIQNELIFIIYRRV